MSSFKSIPNCVYMVWCVKDSKYLAFNDHPYVYGSMEEAKECITKRFSHSSFWTKGTSLSIDSPQFLWDLVRDYFIIHEFTRGE